MHIIKWTSTTEYIIGKTNDEDLTNQKIAAFDLDDTLIKPISGKFGKDENDWQLLNTVKDKLIELSKDHKLVIVTNQKGISEGKIKLEVWQQKLQNIITELQLPFSIFVSFLDNIYRKPNTTFWNFINGNKKESFYCGDAGGLDKRKINGINIPKDFNNTDLKFALNLSIKFIHRDEFIYGIKYDDKKYIIKYPTFDNIQNNELKLITDRQDIIIIVGFPASGK